ncbi:MAG: hypothetical protein ABR879_03730 [Methanomassiliicoccales archaeon]|jgi:hypothetical protein
MRDWYDAPHLEEILEEQHDHLPRGPLGLLLNADIELYSERPPDALALLDSYLDGKIGTLEFATEIEKVRLKAASSPSV